MSPHRISVTPDIVMWLCVLFLMHQITPIIIVVCDLQTRSPWPTYFMLAAIPLGCMAVHTSCLCVYSREIQEDAIITYVMCSLALTVMSKYAEVIYLREMKDGVTHRRD
jgi:hypothetical protein